MRLTTAILALEQSMLVFVVDMPSEQIPMQPRQLLYQLSIGGYCRLFNTKDHPGQVMLQSDGSATKIAEETMTACQRLLK